MKKNSVFPFYLSSFEACRLVKEHLHKEFREATVYNGSSYRYTYYAKLEENGDVSVSVHYNFDDGFAMGSGSCLSQIIRPYDEKELAYAFEKEITRLATIEFKAEEDARVKAAIAKIADRIKNSLAK